VCTSSRSFPGGACCVASPSSRARVVSAASFEATGPSRRARLGSYQDARTSVDWHPAPFCQRGVGVGATRADPVGYRSLFVAVSCKNDALSLSTCSLDRISCRIDVRFSTCRPSPCANFLAVPCREVIRGGGALLRRAASRWQVMDGCTGSLVARCQPAAAIAVLQVPECTRTREEGDDDGTSEEMVEIGGPKPPWLS